MGLVMDSCVLIASERSARSVSELIVEIRRSYGEAEIILSSITVLELEHGIHRANTSEQKSKRRAYLETVFFAIPVQPFTGEMAKKAAVIDAFAKRTGVVIPLADLLIGVTALHFGFALLTNNLRHFQKIPGLVVLSLSA